jgi:DNA-binding response OmpR family regulator
MNKQKINILVVEDDTNLGTLLTDYLLAKGYQADLARNGQEGYEKFCKNKYDFLILDVMMPLKDGYTLAKEIRNADAKIPILFLTAKSMKEDTLEGFKAGADDYMVKPFSMEELLARINAILRRTNQDKKVVDAPVALGDYTFDYMKQELRHPKLTQKLTTKENELLKILSANLNEVVERNYALMSVWGDDSYFNGRSMDVYIAKLRKYLSHDSKVEIQNIHGKGFKLVVNG